MVKVKLDTRKVDKATTIAFDYMVEQVSAAFDDAITSEIWDYPRTTKRRNGRIAGSPRDIVDTGALIDSKTIARAGNGNAVEFSWDVPYAMAVYEGYATNKQTVVPARPWCEKALEMVNPEEVFEQHLRRYL